MYMLYHLRAKFSPYLFCNLHTENIPQTSNCCSHNGAHINQIQLKF